MTSEMQESDYVDKNYCHRSLSPQDHLERERGQGVRGRELGREGGREGEREEEREVLLQYRVYQTNI